jgi:hypothetical protein
VGVGSALRCIELRSRPSCQICTWLFADSFMFSLRCQRPNLIDRNCCVRVRVHPVAVLLSTLQLSRYFLKQVLLASLPPFEDRYRTQGTSSLQ